MTQNSPEQCQEALWNHWNSGGAFPNAPPLLAAREPLAQAKRWADPGRFLFLSPSATMLSCKVIQKNATKQIDFSLVLCFSIGFTFPDLLHFSSDPLLFPASSLLCLMDFVSFSSASGGAAGRWWIRGRAGTALLADGVEAV